VVAAPGLVPILTWRELDDGPGSERDWIDNAAGAVQWSRACGAPAALIVVDAMAVPWNGLARNGLTRSLQSPPETRSNPRKCVCSVGITALHPSSRRQTRRVKSVHSLVKTSSGVRKNSFRWTATRQASQANCTGIHTGLTPFSSIAPHVIFSFHRKERPDELVTDCATSREGTAPSENGATAQRRVTSAPLVTRFPARTLSVLRSYHSMQPSTCRRLQATSPSASATGSAFAENSSA